MRSNLFLVYFFLFFCAFFNALCFISKEQVGKNNFFISEYRYLIKKEGICIGFCHKTEIPFERVIIHDFFIYPNFRNKGYGKSLLNRIFAESNEKVFFIQPEPFDFVSNDFNAISDEKERMFRLNKLIVMYGRAGFKPAKLGFISRLCLRFFYYCFDIVADPSNLMVKLIEKEKL